MKKLIAVAAGLLIASGVALAQKPAFEELDTDGDGMISATEASVHQGLTEIFVDVDADKDGTISGEEYESIK